MDILCLMGLFPKEYESEIIKNSLLGVQNAANKLQWAILNGLQSQRNVNVDVINSLYIGAFPLKYRKAIIPTFSFDLGNEKQGINFGFLNLPIVKYLTKYFTIKKGIKTWIKECGSENKEKVILAYAMATPFVEILNYVKKTHPEVKCILCVPDLPEYMDVTNKSYLYSMVKRLHISHMKKCIDQIDGYILLTEHMKDWFNKEINYEVVEGIYLGGSNQEQDNRAKEKTVLYSGGLCEEYGVMELVDSFLRVKEAGWSLELIGDGPLLSKLTRLAEHETSIIIRGSLPNSEVVKRQKQVSILVNPRKGEKAFTKYSFPSKTIEYMASGTLMIGYRLSGIPEEYYQFMLEVRQEENGLEKCLKKAMRLPDHEREHLGSLARQFILKEKNAVKQCARILDLINRMH